MPIKIMKYIGNYTPCDDCEPEVKRPALYVVEGGPKGYLYLCYEHKEEYERDMNMIKWNKARTTRRPV